MDISITVTIEDENVEELARHGVSLMDTRDKTGQRIGVSLEEWLTAHASKEISRLSAHAYNVTENKVARFIAIAKQIKDERLARDK